MTTAQVGYPPVYRWVKQVLGETHTTVVATVAWAVLCLLVAQRITSAALARALPAEEAGSGRSCLRRVRRWWSGPALDPATISPALIRLARTLLAADQPVVVALDTTRLGPWEVWLAGIVIAGRTLPIGWAVIPYPWPKGRFRATTLALIQQLQQAFPAGVRWTLVADRGFPSVGLFAQLRQGGTDFSVRLRLSDWVTVDRVYATVSAHLTARRLVVGQRTAAMIGRGTIKQPLVLAAIVVSAAVVTPPRHKQNPGTARERAHRAKQHAQARKHKQGRKTKPPSAVAQRYAQTWVLFTTASTVAQAVAEYAGRMSIEETYRDWHHHWAVRAAVVGLPTEAMVTRLIGVVCLAYTVQMHLGQRVSVDPMSQQRRAQWTVTDRISWFWCGQRLFTDPGYDWSGWLAQQWESLGQLMTPALAPSVSEPASLSALQEAA
jgi:Transposase DDE domain